MNCNCLETVLEKVSEQLKPTNEVLDFKCDWKDRVLRLDGGCSVGLYVEKEYYKIKKNGERFTNKTKDSHFVAMSYCPFCGKPFKNAKADKKDS